MNLKRYVIFTYLLLHYSCTSNTANELFNNTLINISPNLTNYEAVIIIPNEGCGGCINDATYFVIENINSFTKNIAIVFTGIKDMKLFKLQIPSHFIERNNVFIDHSNYLDNREISSIYPQALFLEKKKVKSTEVFNKSLFDIKD